MAKIEVELANGAKAGSTLQELTKEASKLNKEISKLPIGSDDFIQKSKQLQDVSGNITKVKNEIKGTTVASDALKQGFGQVLGQIPGFGPLAGMLNQAKGGVGGLTSGFGLLKGAIAATGLGIFLIALGLLINAFSKFTPLIDKVEQVLSGLSAVMSEITQRVQAFGSGLWDIITGVPGGLDKVNNSFDGLTDSISDAYDAGVQLKILQQDLDDLNRGIAITNAQQETQIDRLILQSKNRSLTLKEQNDLLREAKTIAEENFKVNNDLDKKNLDALIKEAQLSSKLSEQEILQLAQGTLAAEKEAARRGELSDELLQKISDAQVKVIEAEGKTNNLLEKIANREAAIREKQEADREKAHAAEEKRIEKEKKAEEDALKAKQKAQEEYYNSLRTLEDMNLQAMAASRERDLIQLKTNLQRQIEELDANAPFYAERVAAAQELARQKRNEINEKWDQKEFEDRLAAIDLELSIDQNAINEKLLARQISEDEFAVQSAQNVVNHEARKLEIIKAAHGEQSAEYQRAYGEFLMLQKTAGDAAVALQEKTGDDLREAILATTSTFGSVFSLLADQYEEGTQQWKNFAIAAATMSAIQGAINAYTSAAAIPYVGTVLAPIAAATALAAGFAQVRKIQNTKAQAPVKASRGMVLQGPSHANGGIPVEAEGDEIILTKGVYRNPLLRAIASDINVAAGGRKFEAGGPVSMPNTGSITTSIANSNNATANAFGIPQMNARLDNLENFAERVDSWAKNLKVNNVVTETEEGIKTVNQIKADADV